MINPRTKSMIFVNTTDLPIIICSWIEKMPGLSEYKEQNDEWQKERLEQDGRIAKFRNTPCASGNYTWNFIEESFVLEHNAGVITWSRKPETTK